MLFSKRVEVFNGKLQRELHLGTIKYTHFRLAGFKGSIEGLVGEIIRSM